MSNEDKVREEFERAHAHIFHNFERRNSGNYSNSFIQAKWEAWKACAAIKDAEIAELKKHNKDLRDNALANEQANYSQIERLVKERVSRDAVIKGLREDLLAIAQSAYMPPALVGIIKQRLANSEHHNSKVLEKMLLEAELKGLKFAYEATYPYSADSELLVNRIAELNRE